MQYDYFYVDRKLMYEKRGNLQFHYRYDVNVTLASIMRVNAAGSTYTAYVICNSRGDVEELGKTDGTVYARYVYDSWGNVLHILDADGNEVTSSNTLAVQNPFRYRGYYYDTETGLYYLQSRYYDPEIGRFINCDDVNYIGITASEISYNPFAYCENNPVNKKDSTGQSVLLATAIGFGVGVLISGCCKLYQNYRTGTIWYKGLAISMLAGGIGGAISCISIPGVSSWVCATVFGAAGNVVTKVILGEIKTIKDVKDAVLQGAGAGLLGNAAAKCLNKIVAAKFATWSKSAQKSFLSKIGKITNRTLRDIRQMIKNSGSTKVIESSIYKVIDKYGYPALVSAFVSSATTSV